MSQSEHSMLFKPTAALQRAWSTIDWKPWRGLLTLLVLLLTGLVILTDFVSVLNQRAAIAELEQRIAQARATPPKVAVPESGQPPGPSRFATTDSNLATAAMQQKLSTLAAETGARVISLAATEKSEDSMVKLEAELDTDQQGLLRLVHAVEKSVPFFFIERLSAYPQKDSKRFNVTLRLEAAVGEDKQ